MYVDHIILIASSDYLRCTIISLLASEFAMKDLGELHYYLGIPVRRQSGGLFLSQQKYATTIIERFGMSSCKSSLTPVYTEG